MGFEPSLSSAFWFPQLVSGVALLVWSHRGASSSTRANGKVRSGICAVSPLSGRPRSEVVEVALLVSDRVRATVRSCSSSAPASTRTLPYGSDGLVRSASSGPVLAGMCNASGSSDGSLEKTIALPAGISPKETTKRTGLGLAISPSQDYPLLAREQCVCLCFSCMWLQHPRRSRWPRQSHVQT